MEYLVIGTVVLSGCTAVCGLIAVFSKAVDFLSE